MKKKLLTALILAGALPVLSIYLPIGNPQVAVAKPQTKSLSAMSNPELDTWLATLQKQSLTQRIAQVSEKALGTPYFLGPLGEGPGAPYDAKPLIDLKRVDCVTFCEQTLALALAKNSGEALQILQKIRYKQGKIAMEYRNHYFMADWVPNNRWLVKDITATLPGAQPLTRTISHRTLFANQGFKDIHVQEPDRTLTVHYIPDTALDKVLPQLKSGDIGVFIQDMPGIFASHTGFMIQNAQGKMVFRNATSIGPKQVTDLPWPELVAYLKQSKRVIGMAFVRPETP